MKPPVARITCDRTTTITVGDGFSTLTAGVLGRSRPWVHFDLSTEHETEQDVEVMDLVGFDTGTVEPLP